MKDNGPEDNGPEDSDDLDELRRLLLGAELEKIEQLRSKLEVPENFSREVGDVLPRAMVKSSEHGEELSEAMVPTVEEIVRLSIKKDINKFADALFPVIGPAIRKSIRETIRQMLQSLNQTLEQSLSWQGMRWRLESIRTGIPFAQIAMLHGLVYRVEQVFLIHRETGLLLCHLAQNDKQNQNPDLVSSMLSAINDFVGDSFEVETERSLNSVEVGDISIWLELGPDTILAVAIRGEAPNHLRTVLQQTLEQLQNSFADAFGGFDGDTDAFEDCEGILRDCLQAKYRAERKGLSAKTLIVALLLLLGLGYWLGLSWQQSQRHERYVNSLKQEPGYLLTTSYLEDGVFIVEGLRDPLARDPDSLLSNSPLDPAAVRHRFKPYQSLDAEIVAQRARNILQPPETVKLEFSGAQLRLEGVADLSWRRQLLLRLPMIAGLESYDDSALKTRFTPELLEPPPGVTVQLDNRVVYLQGAADQDWILSLAEIPDQYAEVDAIDTRALTNLTEAALVSEITLLEKQAVFFDAATSYDFDSIDVPKIAGISRKIIALANKLSRSVLIVVRGYSDSIGSFEDNVFLSRERADFVAQAISNTGISPRYISIQGIDAPVEVENSEAERRFNRRVGFEVIVE
ncbi:MAG: OmpA family protein [Gammaproteobacteria bacterium]|nr:OmpA family protein [Gammaproteobacteria bacterium]